jgi:hypothetical protein
VRGAVAEQPVHADVVGVVVLDPLLAAERVPDRGQDPPGQLHDLVVRARAPGAAEQRDRARGVQRVGQGLHLLGHRPHR